MASSEIMNFRPEDAAPANFEPSTTTEMVTTRQAQEVQAAMIVAKRFPRDDVNSFNRIMRSCQRQSLAEQAMYEFPRGGTSVTGPSIRLAEAMAQSWGNLDFGVIELEQKHGESVVMSYCWDLETNTRQTKIFTVPHIRQTRRGATVLTDPRDIYEMVANQGARRLRACILGIIPGDVVDAAVDQCQKTLKSGSKEPLVDRVRKMAHCFQEEFGVTLVMLEGYIGCKSEAFTEQSVVRLRSVYKSLKDGMASREQYFDLSAAEPPAKKQDKADAKPHAKKTDDTQDSTENPPAVSMDDL